MIEVTEEEVRKIARIIEAQPLPVNLLFGVQRVFDTLNRIRQGDPIGTVRRDPSGYRHAIKATVTGWIVTTSDPISTHWLSNGEVADWTIVYDPTVGK